MLKISTTMNREHNIVHSSTRSDKRIKEHFDAPDTLYTVKKGGYTKHTMGEWQIIEYNRWDQYRNKTKLTLLYNKRGTSKKFIIESIEKGEKIDGLHKFSGYDLMFKRIE
jgi:hypothetical protein